MMVRPFVLNPAPTFMLLLAATLVYLPPLFSWLVNTWMIEKTRRVKQSQHDQYLAVAGNNLHCILHRHRLSLVYFSCRSLFSSSSYISITVKEVQSQTRMFQPPTQNRNKRAIRIRLPPLGRGKGDVGLSSLIASRTSNTSRSPTT